MVFLDSLHNKEHVLAELKAYAPLVSPGSYIIVEDTHLDSIIWPDGAPGPFAAVEAFLGSTPRPRSSATSAGRSSWSRTTRRISTARFLGCVGHGYRLRQHTAMRSAEKTAFAEFGKAPVPTPRAQSIVRSVTGFTAACVLVSNVIARHLHNDGLSRERHR